MFLLIHIQFTATGQTLPVAWMVLMEPLPSCSLILLSSPRQAKSVTTVQVHFRNVCFKESWFVF